MCWTGKYPQPDGGIMIGTFKGWLYPENYFVNGISNEMNDNYLVTDTTNTIQTPLKTRVRDMITAASSSVYYMGEGWYFNTCTSGNSQDGWDGIVVIDDSDTYGVTLVTTLHPTDPSGNYYKQWRGVATFPCTGTFSVAVLGIDWDGETNIQFANEYARVSIDTFSPSVGEIFVADWKISIV